VSGILAATDGSPGGAKAVAFAAAMARKFDEALLLLNVMPEFDPDTGSYHGVDPGDTGLKRLLEAERMPLGEFLENASREILSAAKACAEAEGVSRIITVSRGGDPADVILAVAAEHASDVIAVGKRGRGRLAGLLLGSVSQKLVTLAPCVVLVVP